MWFVVSLFSSYAGWAALALAMDRHHRQLWRHAPSGNRSIALRAAGGAGLALSFAACIPHWGWAIGPVAWFGVLFASALGFVLLLTYAPRAAAGLALLAVPAGTVAAALA
jgi:hypothetical protein